MGKNLWSIRMRASRRDMHVSGAEGIYGPEDINGILNEYAFRALNHPKGTPDNIVLTIEILTSRPKTVAAPDVCTLRCENPRMAKTLIKALLDASGISKAAVFKSFSFLRGKTSGAVLLSAETGRRLDNEDKGIRVSRIGIEKSALSVFKRRLTRHNINTSAVREAVILASKVSSAPGICAELCVSDDPGYTTGYVASRMLGYVRIPNIKRNGSLLGGRVFFCEDGADIRSLKDYLKHRPVVVSKSPAVAGQRSLDEIICGIDS